MPREKTPTAGKTPVRRRTVKSNGTPAEITDMNVAPREAEVPNTAVAQAKRTAERRPSAGAQTAASRAGFSEEELDQIRRRAYEFYQQRGGQDGSDQDDWYRAEQEIRNRRRSA